MGIPYHYAIDIPKRCYRLLSEYWDQVQDTSYEEFGGPLATTFLVAMAVQIITFPVERIAKDNTIDIGRLYVVLDGKTLVERAGHYLIYGSEWMMAVLGYSGQRVLKTIGTPTLLEIDLPLSLISTEIRQELAEHLLLEWTRRVCNRTDWAAEIDFTFCLEQDIPAEWIVGHSHPSRIEDQHDDYRIHVPASTTCKYCEGQSSPQLTQPPNAEMTTTASS